MADYVLQFTQFITKQALSVGEWLRFLNFLFPEVQRQREASAALARRFYDDQRRQFHPELPRNDRPIEPTDFRTFVQNMEPTRRKMSQEDSPNNAVASVALRAVREVENAGRQQIIHAVKNEPEPKVLRGWARVATGRETCAWCLMLISRGPTYLGADTAGLDLDDESAVSMIAAGEDVSDYMEQWHDGCDCKVVPVFKQEGWFGQAAASRALKLWNDASQEADRILEEDPDKKSFVKGKWIPTTRNREALNALRRRLERGDVSPTEFAALAAA
ncbi:hypothetical protein QXL92_02610 [Mycobacterium paragordonae]|uniref:Capsid maturation protease n=1 Tax=Mycobacterium paragordonae TaxID=1389713 RepID=A0AAJ1RZY1_9MYCO|nr:hypothetical protein [Mycobacterium paragordonae]MDP7733649.1 hypothetical protein [Mycobacterium paragordonae]